MKRFKKIDRYGRIEYRFSYLMTLSFCAVILNLLIGGTLLYFAEQGAPNGNIRNFEDALWLADMMISTVGFGDHYPVTTMGRVTGFFIIIVGAINIGTFIGLGARLVKTSSDVDNRQILIESMEQTRLLQGIEKAVDIQTKIDKDTHELEEVYNQERIFLDAVWQGWLTIGRDSGGTYAMSIEAERCGFPLKKWIPADDKAHLLNMWEYRNELLRLHLIES